MNSSYMHSRYSFLALSVAVFNLFLSLLQVVPSFFNAYILPFPSFTHCIDHFLCNPWLSCFPVHVPNQITHNHKQITNMNDHNAWTATATVRVDNSYTHCIKQSVRILRPITSLCIVQWPDASSNTITQKYQSWTIQACIHQPTSTEHQVVNAVTYRT